MAERKHTHGLELTLKGNLTVLSIGTMEIWDGADLSLVRDTIFRLVKEDDISAIGIDLSCVQHVPSGFFGMLFDWYERGIAVQLIEPRERVQQMLWFRKFFACREPGIYSLHDGEGVDEAVSEELWDRTVERNGQRFPAFTS